MENLNYIIDRRSIRRFTDQKVDNLTLKEILRAAMYAPSAVNKQPWHFVVIDDPTMLRKIMEIHPHAGMLQTASHAIVVCGDEELQHDDGYWVVDCGAATQNLLLAAHTLGLGTCWVGLQPREERKTSFSRLLSLPPQVKPFAMVALGYPKENKSRPQRFHPGKVKYNGWEKPFFTEKA
jgi:nitroreductase